MLTPKCGGTPVVRDRELRNPDVARAANLRDLGAGRGGIFGAPLAKVVDSDEPLTRLRELEDGILVIHRMRTLRVAGAVREVVA